MCWGYKNLPIYADTLGNLVNMPNIYKSLQYESYSLVVRVGRVIVAKIRKHPLQGPVAKIFIQASQGGMLGAWV